MKLDAQFFSSPTGQLIAVGALAALAAGAVAWQRAQGSGAAMPSASAAAPASLPKVFDRAGARFEPPPSPPALPGALPPAPAVSEPSVAPRVLPLAISIAAAVESKNQPEASAPYGRLIPCETVVTLESSRLETPVIGLVTDNVWQSGRLVIPAGAEVHGRASLDRARERLAAQGQWTIVWSTPGQGSSHELRVGGIALDREFGADGSWGAHDGSAGLRGQILRTGDLREARLFAASFLSAATSALQDTRTTAGILGETAVPAATARNAALAGTSAILRERAQQLRDAVAQDGFYVHVPAGKPFYLYVTESLGGSGNAAAAESTPPAPSTL